MLKNLLLIWIVVSVPIMLISYAWALKLMFAAAGPIIFLIACAAHVTGWIAIGFLIDSLRQQQTLPKRGR